MKRVLVIGGYGAGKTTFALRLQRETGLPFYQLDDLYWDHAGAGNSRQDWRSQVERIASGDSWIIDGNYGGTIDLRLRRADTVVFFDYSPLLCMSRVFRRFLLTRIGVCRRDVVTGCNDRLDPQIVKSVLTFRKRHRDGILSGVRRYPDLRLVIFRSQGDVKRFFREIGRRG